MQIRPALAFTLFFALLAMVATAGRDKQKKNKNVLSPTQRADVTYVYFNANKEKILGNLNTAADLFSEVLRKDPGNSAAMYELSRVYVAQKKYADALYFSKGAYKADPANIWYALNYSDVLQSNDRYKESAEVLEKLVGEFPGNAELYQRLAEAYIYGGEYEDGIGAYDRMDKQFGVTNETAVIKARIYQQLKKPEKAVEELKKLIAEEPNDVEAYTLMAEIYKASGQNEKALETYKKVESIDPENPMIHLSLADFYRDIGEKEKSIEELKKSFTNPQLDIETKISILASYFALIETYPELKEQAHEMCRLMIQTHGSDPRAHAVYGDFLTMENQYDSARVQYRIARQLGSREYSVFSQLLAINAQLEDWKSMEEDSKEALALFPDQPLPYLYSGLALHHTKKEKDAAKILEEGINLVVDNNSLEIYFRSTLGEVYNDMKDYARSDQQYDKVLELDPNDASALNNYAYYLSLRKEKLQKAEEMSKSSIELQPDEASYEDTYGWILFVGGKYAEAKLWIGRSLEHGGDKSAAVLEHYGDVLFKLGDMAGALDYWQRAKSAGEGASEFLDRKILEKKYLE